MTSRIAWATTSARRKQNWLWPTSATTRSSPSGTELTSAAIILLLPSAIACSNAPCGVRTEVSARCAGSTPATVRAISRDVGEVRPGPEFGGEFDQVAALGGAGDQPILTHVGVDQWPPQVLWVVRHVFEKRACPAAPVSTADPAHSSASLARAAGHQ